MTDNFGLNKRTIESLNAIFAKYPEIKQVVIYGSRAKGNYRKGSDIDLTLKGDGIPFSLLLKIENEIEELLLPYKIDLSIYDKIDSIDVKEHICRVGKIFG
jgi:predicted nucleotidyltransferase